MSIRIPELEQALDAFTADKAERIGIKEFFQSSYDLTVDRKRILGRYRQLIKQFGSRCDGDEVSIARAPGRINLIGEHTDYNGLPVLPMAINRDIAAVFAPREDALVVINNTASHFEERRFELVESIPPFETGDWGNYCKAAVQGLLDHFSDLGKGSGTFRGFQVLFDGDLPPASGMSSSSALVVLCALIFLKANDLEMDKLKVADLMAGAERYVGTQGGGMDQAASLLGQAGCALTIHFNPLRVQPVRMPPGYVIVAANSMVQAAKTAGAMDEYNRRSIECRLAAAVLRFQFSGRYGRPLPIRLLGDLNPDTLGLSLEEIDDLAETVLRREPYSLEEIAAVLEVPAGEVVEIYCTRRDGSVFPEPGDGFKLRDRYQHVVHEGRRVEQSVHCFQENDMPAFGELMNRSHVSCRDLYEISCPELDKLVEIALEAGALGSRLTGAGFGGCTVSLVRREKAAALIERMIQGYYREYLDLEREDYSQIIFACKAVNGAAVAF